MIPSIRNTFNKEFTEAKYNAYLAAFEKDYPGAIEFRIAETPLFVPKAFKHKLLEVSNYIGDYILADRFQSETAHAIPTKYNVPNESPFPECVVMDFAVSTDTNGVLVPQLIELQGFPSLFAFEILQDQAIRENYAIPLGFTNYLNNYNESNYIKHLTNVIKGNKNKHTVLLELFPHKQKTRIDFYCTQTLMELPIVCLSEIYTIGNHLFYNREGTPQKIERVYNRLVWDELSDQSTTIQAKRDLLLQNLELEWVSHPNHFYRISKYLLPFLKHNYIPSANLLSTIETIPAQLEDYVLKPLFSFAGQGVMIDVTPAAIENIVDPENWILQEKVQYSPIIETPTGPAKAEIRLFCFYDNNKKRYIATNNLTRLSKGKMIGVDYNKTATWVGGSLSYFEND